MVKPWRGGNGLVVFTLKDRNAQVVVRCPVPVAQLRGRLADQGILAGYALGRDYPELADALLLCATELCSLHQSYGWDPEQIVANALFADGSAAAVLTGADLSRSRGLRVIANGSTRP